MPRRTIFVRDDDLYAFESITDRPGWLHWAILKALEYQCTCDKFPVPHQHLVDDGKSYDIRPNIIRDGTTYIDPDQMP